MPRTSILLVLATIGLIFLFGRPSSAPAQEPIPDGILAGQVLSVSDSLGVEGALLTISLQGRDPTEQARAGVESIEFRTGAEGRFSVALTPGQYALRVEAFGFEEDGMEAVRIRAGQTTEITLFLETAPIRLDEIVVMPSTYGILGDHLVSGQILTREELETQPQLGNDIFRAVAQVPGVTTQDYTAMPYVRGGRPREVLTMLDGVELYEPYHMKMWDGSLSIVGVENVSDVDLTTGGFTVEHGDASTGVFSMRTADPEPGGTKTTVGLDFMSSILQSKGTFGDDRGAWLVSARRGFLDLVFKLTGRAEEEDLHPSYYDVFSKVEYEVRPGHVVSAHVLHAGDDNHGIEEDSTVYVHRYGSSYGWMTWDADLRDDLSARSILSIGRITRDRDGEDYWNPADPPALEVKDQAAFDFVGLRQEWRYQPSDEMMLKFGFDTKWGRADYDYLRWEKNWIPNSTDPEAPGWALHYDTESSITEKSGTEIGVFLASRAQPLSSLTFEAGLRYDRQSHTGEHQIAPRINAAFQLSPGTTLRGAWGHFHQSHGLHQLWVADGDTNFFPAQRAEHRVLGLEHRFEAGPSVRLEAYDRLVTDPLPEYRSLEDHVEGLREESHGDRVFLEPERGRARGIELFAKSSGRSWFGWSASYALSETKERIDGEWAPLPFDQRHAVNIQLTLKPTPNWSVNAGWVYHSPWPFTKQHFGTATTVDGYVYIVQEFGSLNQERLIPYQRFDFRASRWFRTSRGDLLVYVDVFNFTNRENAQAADYGAWWYQGRLIVDQTYHTQLEVMPSMGLRWTF